MDNKIKLGPQDIIFPVPAALVVTGTFEKPNILTIAWIGMVSSNPHVIGISLDKHRYSYELIIQNKQFSINIPSSKNYAETDFCGIKSGRNIKKFEQINFTPIRSSVIEPPIIKECPFNLECVVVQELSFKNYHAFFGEIVETYIDSDKINRNNDNKIDISKVDPLIYIATVREYWSIGKKLGNSFDAGKSIIKINNELNTSPDKE